MDGGQKTIEQQTFQDFFFFLKIWEIRKNIQGLAAKENFKTIFKDYGDWQYYI